VTRPNKTAPTDQSVEAYLAGIDNEQRQADSVELVALMQATTGAAPVMWGSSIVGFGTHHYRYATGREGDTVAVGFAARKQALVIYGALDDDGSSALLADLGPHKRGKGCLYIKRLDDVDLDELRQLIRVGYEQGTQT
jgi:hypothetical protein